ncbi:MAG: family 43 glycosylhydrolase [Lachnoclostridium sp.]
MMKMKKRVVSFMLLLSLLLSVSIGTNNVYAASEPENVSAYEESYEYNLKAEDILIRDPYIVVYEGKYYMYGTDGTNAFGGQMDSFPVWVSEDLENWAGPYTIFKNDGSFWADKQYWAPEVYYIDGEFYLYGSMGGSSRQNKGIQLFKSESPLGPFEPTTEYPFTPEEDDDIDATLYEEDGIMYMVYSQGKDGIYAVKLNDTLDGFADTQFKLFDVSECSWPIAAFGGMVLNDGPCFYTTSSGRLLCLFSSMSEDGYNMGIAYSDNGKLDGNWTMMDERLDVGSDGGHCMIFENLDGQTMICYHAPNGSSHPQFRYLIEDTENDIVYASETPPENKVSVDEVFEDVKSDDWFKEYVQYVYDNEIMTGLNATHFGPNDTLARAQFALILYRMEGTPSVDYKDIFPDVPNNTWFTDAVLWANTNGIVTGYTDTRMFGPADKINREQMAVMMYRYAKYLGCATDTKANLSQFKDGGSVSGFAKEAMQWAVGTNIITGKYNETVLDPQGNATRGECAAIVQRFIENVIE